MLCTNNEVISVIIICGFAIVHQFISGDFLLLIPLSIISIIPFSIISIIPLFIISLRNNYFFFYLNLF